jgi:hypothetical protein
MVKKGSFCYVVPSCRASPAAAHAVGKIVEVVAGPYQGADGGIRAVYFDVRYGSALFYCHADKLRPISDPDVDVSEPQDGRLAT